MQVRSGYERMTKYAAKFAEPLQGVLALKSKATATLTFNRATRRMVPIEHATKLILGEAGVSKIQNPFYINFSRKVLGLKLQGIMGDQLIYMVDVELNLSVGRGLDRDILERIRNTVFAIAAPAL